VFFPFSSVVFLLPRLALTFLKTVNLSVLIKPADNSAIQPDLFNWEDELARRRSVDQQHELFLLI
jgi:hypothetical protein